MPLNFISPKRLFLNHNVYILLTYTGHVVGIAAALRQQPVPDLPGEDAGALPLVVADLVNHRGGRHPGLRAADGARLN